MKPFLKWAGNKYRIVERIKQALPSGNRLIEPFTGSGALFLNTEYSSYYLGDANFDLITLFQTLQSNKESFIEDCRAYFEPSKNNAEVFYACRDIFNTTTDLYLKSLLFVYLNRHCFNGLCRYNASGGFNTPFGQYKKAYFPEKEMRYFGEKAQNAVFTHSDFVTTMQNAKPGDVIYCDPPYVPLSKTANFTAFSTGGFGAEQQMLLANTAIECAARGVKVIVSNHDTEFTREAYSQAEITAFDVQRFISSKGDNRGKAQELLAVFG